MGFRPGLLAQLAADRAAGEGGVVDVGVIVLRILDQRHREIVGDGGAGLA